MSTTYYSAPIKTPASKREGLGNAVQMAVNALEAGEHQEALLQLANILDDVRSVSNPYNLDTQGEPRTPAAVGSLFVARIMAEAPRRDLTPFDAINAVNLDTVPVMATDRCIARKEQAKLTRQLFKDLGIKGISVTTPNYSMAQSVYVRIPQEPFPGWTGFEEWQNHSYADIPDHVPAKAARRRHHDAEKKIGEILAIAFPNHDDRSDSQTDYFDSCWSIS